MFEAAKTLLKGLCERFEGRRKKPYLCPAQVPTIGLGSTRYEDGTPVTLKDPPITDKRIDSLFSVTADSYINAAVKLSPALTISSEKLAAISDFIYNLGSARYKASTLRRKVNEQNWTDAGEQLMKWVWGGGKKLPGLVLRRAAEREMLE